MTKMAIGWIFICCALAICCLAYVWFSDNTYLTTVSSKCEYTFIILFGGMLLSYLAIVIEFIINYICSDIFKDEEKDYFVRKLK